MMPKLAHCEHIARHPKRRKTIYKKDDLGLSISLKSNTGNGVKRAITFAPHTAQSFKFRIIRIPISNLDT